MLERMKHLRCGDGDAAASSSSASAGFSSMRSSNNSSASSIGSSKAAAGAASKQWWCGHLPVTGSDAEIGAQTSRDYSAPRQRRKHKCHR